MKNRISAILFTVSLIVLAGSQGCKDENPLTITGLGSLYDPALKPSVIFTYPGNNTVGPFSGIYLGDGMYSSPHFKIQFNKYMKSEFLTDEYIKISGFDEPVAVSHQYYYSDAGFYSFNVSRKIIGESYYSQIPYALGKTYTVTVSSKVEDIHNQPLGKDFQFTFSMGTAFKVMSALPKDSLSRFNNEVRMNFNSPVDSSILSKVTITPAIAGNWYIFNNGFSLMFYNSTTFPINTTYTVTLAANASDKNGNILGTPFSYNFKTGDFKLEASYPSDGQTYVSLNYEMSFYFSGTILFSSVPAAFSISPSAAGTFSYFGSGFSFLPSEPLKEKTLYTVTVKNTLASTAGMTLPSPYTMSFTTEGFRIKQFLPYYYTKVSRYSNIEVEFNTKVDTASAIAGIVIAPTTAGKFYFTNKFQSVAFKPDAALLPNTQYSVTVANTVKSVSGNALENNSIHTFNTGD